MKKKIIYGVLLLLFVIGKVNAEISRDVVIVERIILSNSVTASIDNTFDPGDSVEIITDKDKIIFYRANIAVLNPTKKKYDIEMTCVDSKDNMVYKGLLKMSLSELNGDVDKDIIGRAAQHLGLNPKPGSMIKGQLIPLVDNNDYFIKLYVEKKLIGVTQFHYTIKKEQ